jgi:hypothetical protein
VEEASDPADAVSLVYESFTRGDSEEEGRSPEPVLEPDGAPIVGNTRTLVYHRAGGENLPAPEHRIFFASVEQAEAQGYHADPTEARPQGTDQIDG